MSKYITVTAMGYRPKTVEHEPDFSVEVDGVIEHWRGRLERVRADRPDMIVLPEACDRVQMPGASRLEFLRYKGERVLDFFRAIAREDQCYIVYSAVRDFGDGSFRNSSFLIGRDGEIVGVYDKNYPTDAEMERTGVKAGSTVEAFQCDFGTVVCAICFDINFEELRRRHAALRPDIVVFSSNFHAGAKARTWAYETRSYFVGALGYGGSDHCYVITPTGKEIASGAMDMLVTARINLDSCLIPLNYNLHYNLGGIERAKSKYGNRVRFDASGDEDVVLMTYEADDRTVHDIAEECGIVLLDDYYENMARIRKLHMA